MTTASDVLKLIKDNDVPIIPPPPPGPSQGANPAEYLFDMRKATRQPEPPQTPAVPPPAPTMPPGSTAPNPGQTVAPEGTPGVAPSAAPSGAPR